MLAGTAETVTVAVPAWLLAVVAFLGTLLGGAISFAVNQILIKGAADRAAKKREKDDEQRRERYILQMDSRKATFDLLSCICAGIERMETETGQDQGRLFLRPTNLLSVAPFQEQSHLRLLNADSSRLRGRRSIVVHGLHLHIFPP